MTKKLENKPRSLGQALRKVREERNVKLRDLSEALSVSLPFLSDVEMGRRPLSEDRIRLAADFLEADPRPLLELAMKDRGSVILDIKSVGDKRKQEAAMLLAMSWPNLPKKVADFLITNLKTA